MVSRSHGSSVRRSTTSADILDRLNEITFNAALIAEMRAIARRHRDLARNLAAEIDPALLPAFLPLALVLKALFQPGSADFLIDGLAALWFLLFALFPFVLSGAALGNAQGCLDMFVEGARIRASRYNLAKLADFQSIQIKIAAAIDPRLLEGDTIGVVAPEDLAGAVQSELKRVGCYQMAVDGSWGKGSRTALTSSTSLSSLPSPLL